MKRLVESFEEFTSKKSGVKKLNEGTSNFGTPNASKIYAIGMGYEEEFDEDGEPYENDFSDMLQDEIDNVRIELKSEEVFGKDFNLGSFKRSIYSAIGRDVEEIGVVGEYFTIRGVDYSVNVYCFAQSGYHEGAMLDWYVEVINQGEDYNIDYSPTSQEIPLKIKQWVSRTTKQIENVYSKYSTKLEVSARFDNGETWYSKSK